MDWLKKLPYNRRPKFKIIFMKNDKLLTLPERYSIFHKQMCESQTMVSRLTVSRHHSRKLAFACIVSCLIIFPLFLSAQSAVELKKLSFEELMNIEVTSVSKVPEKLTEVASAIQVLTNDDIHRSASNSLPEALRLASNLQVAKPNSHDWAISSRGFNAAPLRNNTLSNKLLVLIDGRSVYTPLFGGVFWDVQNVMLEDLDRVEVVSGPGGTLWGANAVNGVINVITKSAKETQGIFITASSGTFLQDQLAARFGSRLDSNLYLRIYGQHIDQGSMKSGSGADAKDGWGMTQGGFRLDYYPSPKNTLSVHGDVYGGEEDSLGLSKRNGQNITAKWIHAYSETSELVLQAYFDRTWTYQAIGDFRELLNTYDVDMQHHFRLDRSNSILWGLGYRLTNDNVSNSFVPAEKYLNLINTFIQDQITLAPHKLELTVGTKFLYNDYSGLEIQPSARMAWTPAHKHTLWAAVSRAVRTPSRFETDFVSPALTTTTGFKSEKVIAYEIGYRARLAERISLSLATFYNDYTDLRSIDTINTTSTPRFIFANHQKATTWGLEISSNVVATDWWRLRLGYTYIDKNFTSTSPKALATADLIEALDPKHQVMMQSIMNLTKHLQWDVTARYVDNIKSTLTVGVAVPSYTTFDVRLAWESRRFSFSVQGQNLAAQDHTEFATRQVPRSILGKISFRF